MGQDWSPGLWEARKDGLGSPEGNTSHWNDFCPLPLSTGRAFVWALPGWACRDVEALLHTGSQKGDAESQHTQGKPRSNASKVVSYLWMFVGGVHRRPIFKELHSNDNNNLGTGGSWLNDCSSEIGWLVRGTKKNPGLFPDPGIYRCRAPQCVTAITWKWFYSLQCFLSTLVSISTLPVDLPSNSQVNSRLQNVNISITEMPGQNCLGFLNSEPGFLS